MKIKLPENLSSIVLPEVGKVIADENGEIEVSETLGNSLSKNLGWKIVDSKQKPKPEAEEIEDEESEDLKPAYEEDEDLKTEEKSKVSEEDESNKLSEVQLKKLKVSELIEVATEAGISEEVINKAVGEKKNRKVDLIKILLDVIK